MKRLTLPLVVVLGLLALAPVAQASDASLRRALKSYESRLTSDIGYLSSFSAPSRSSAGGVLRRLSKISGDLTGATRAATRQRASTRNGNRGRTLVLAALRNAMLAVGHARASANAARSGKRATARSQARSEQTDINAAIRQFQSGGRLLHLF